MRIYRLANGKEVTRPRTWWPLVLAAVLAMLLLSVCITGFDPSVLVQRGGQFFVIVGQMFPPDLAYTHAIWGPLFDTIKMSLFGSFIGAALAVPFALLAASNVVKNRAAVAASRALLSVLRTVPSLVSALIATYLFGLGTMAGTAAIAIFTFAYVGKLLYEQIETTDMGAYEALEAMGASPFRAFLAAIWPQVLPGYLSVSLFCFEGNVRYASILGYVGAGGLGLLLNEKIGWREYSGVGMILLMLLCTVFVIENISQYLRRKLT
ncbi:phosphonate ABC transporter, permease protein PhnE [Ethanoligenens harbinense]|uniref:phosphonate ABC transporter, permease protein PhnE n=1 Tax=Ethanoligenens harbinense TaxID=253239 RepID=UPI000EA2C3D4|nr:phosphonate ABC transporter, permease protein PhnE [Ethanoligenens harbinense]AYF41780.1 phosphonate ABC transporter, permease protein PhnE [Ethanoligenens harbinense]